MARSPAHLREDAIAIWRAGVEAVRPERLFADQLRLSHGVLDAGDRSMPLDRFDRIAVVGGGKAGAGMVRGLETLLGAERLARHRVEGLVSVPEGCVEATAAVRLVAGRPAGANEPRPEGEAAAEEMLRLVESLTPGDLCICLISGGGSALLPAPIDGVTLDQKRAVTRLLSASGATINQLNTVRASISRVKGGGLARACGAGVLLALIISDVLGDPLEVIASGPTVPTTTGPRDALQVFDELKIASHPAAEPIVRRLRRLAKQRVAAHPPRAEIHNLILANNAVAVDAAGAEAERRGYNHAMDCATASEGAAEGVGRSLAAMALEMRDYPGPNCLITGGEPTVTLADPAVRGRGGRNQQLVLAALTELRDRGEENLRGIALLSGGTDGEDGPTDAAGALIDERVAGRAAAARLDPIDSLARNDAYPFFKACGGLITTGPTNTNVCDLRVVTVDQAGA